MFSFPWKNYRDRFVRDGPVGCVGSGNKSGWMTEFEFAIHKALIFVKHCRPTLEQPVFFQQTRKVQHGRY